MNVMYEIAGKECAHSAKKKKKHSTNRKTKFKNRKLQIYPVCKNVRKDTINKRQRKTRRRIQERAVGSARAGQRASAQTLHPAALSHHCCLTVIISHNADILNKTLEMQAAHCPHSKKKKKKRKKKRKKRKQETDIKHSYVHTEPR